MIRVLIFVVIVFALGLGFAWLADVPGEVVLTIDNKAVTVPLMVAGVAIVASIVVAMLAWWIIKVVFTSPQRMQRFFRARRRDRGYQSLSTGIIAAGAGDSASARKMLKQAGGLLSSTTEPLLHLLDAQATMLEGDHAGARKKFESMLEDPETRILGLRGLYMEAQRLGERDAQRHYAEKAVELAPQLSWASKAALDLKTADGDWDGAIRLLDKQKSTKQLSKAEANRKRAVLLTALAQSKAETDPPKAKSAGLEAHKLAPEFAPAAVIAAEAAFRLNETRRGVKVLETTWRKAPHPDVALAYVNARPGDSALDRLKRAERLAELKPNNTESNLIVAQIAMEAAEFSKARKSIAAVLRDEPRESAFMLMADIEDAETGDQGKVREWLSRAVRAQRDPAWTSDGYVSEKWAPFSPITGKIDAFEWKVPVEKIGGSMIENDLDPMEPGLVATDLVEHVAEAKEVAPQTIVASSDEVEQAAKDGVPIETHEVRVITDEDTPSVEEEANSIETHEVRVVTANSNGHISEAKTAEPAEEVEEEKSSEVLDDNPDVESSESALAQEAKEENKEELETDEITIPIPDDPGVRSEKEAPPDKRFRLF